MKSSNEKAKGFEYIDTYDGAVMMLSCCICPLYRCLYRDFSSRSLPGYRSGHDIRRAPRIMRVFFLKKNHILSYQVNLRFTKHQINAHISTSQWKLVHLPDLLESHGSILDDLGKQSISCSVNHFFELTLFVVVITPKEVPSSLVFLA